MISEFRKGIYSLIPDELETTDSVHVGEPEVDLKAKEVIMVGLRFY